MAGAVDGHQSRYNPADRRFAMSHIRDAAIVLRNRERAMQTFIITYVAHNPETDAIAVEVHSLDQRDAVANLKIAFRDNHDVRVNCFMNNDRPPVANAAVFAAHVIAALDKATTDETEIPLVVATPVTFEIP